MLNYEFCTAHWVHVILWKPTNLSKRFFIPRRKGFTFCIAWRSWEWIEWEEIGTISFESCITWRKSLEKKDVDRHHRSMKGGPFSPPCFSSSCHVMDHHHKDGRIGRGIEQENWKIHLSTMANDIQLGSEPNRFSATLESTLLLAWYLDP